MTTNSYMVNYGSRDYLWTLMFNMSIFGFLKSCHKQVFLQQSLTKEEEFHHTTHLKWSGNTCIVYFFIIHLNKLFMYLSKQQVVYFLDDSNLWWGIHYVCSSCYITCLFCIKLDEQHLWQYYWHVTYTLFELQVVNFVWQHLLTWVGPSTARAMRTRGLINYLIVDDLA